MLCCFNWIEPQARIQSYQITMKNWNSDPAASAGNHLVKTRNWQKLDVLALYLPQKVDFQWLYIYPWNKIYLAPKNVEAPLWRIFPIEGWDHGMIICCTVKLKFTLLCILVQRVVHRVETVLVKVSWKGCWRVSLLKDPFDIKFLVWGLYGLKCL